MQAIVSEVQLFEFVSIMTLTQSKWNSVNSYLRCVFIKV